MKFSIFNWKRTTTSKENKSIHLKLLRFFTDDFNRLVLGVHCFYADEKAVQDCFPQSVLKMKIRSSCFFYCIFLQWALLTQVYYFYIVSQLLTKPWLNALTAMKRHFHFWFLAYVALNIALPLCTSYPRKTAVPATQQWCSPSRTSRAWSPVPICRCHIVNTTIIDPWTI